MKLPDSHQTWGDVQERHAHFDETIIRSRKANYGFQKVPAGEKNQWVLRHFNLVARKYDFMNTLLSLGIHYLWKRTAVGLENR